MNTTVSLNGVPYTPASIKHVPSRISTVLEYVGGKKQEFFRATKHNFDLLFVCNEAQRIALESLSETGSITFINELGVSRTVRPALFTAMLVDGASPTNPLFEITLSLEEVG